MSNRKLAEIRENYNATMGEMRAYPQNYGTQWWTDRETIVNTLGTILDNHYRSITRYRSK